MASESLNNFLSLSNPLLYVLVVCLIAMLIFYLIFFKYYLPEKKKQIARLRHHKKRYQQLALYLQSVQELERQRISMELHDNIGQKMYLLNMTVKGNEEQSKLIKEIVHDLRGVIYDLKPRGIEDFGLLEAARMMIEDINKLNKIKGTVNCHGEQYRFDKKNEVYIFRIIQEAVSNILKHSHAENFTLHMNYERAGLEVTISDNGKGFKRNIINTQKGNGLLNMNERVRALSGKMKITSDSDGTKINFNIPNECNKNNIVR